ncbi:MAG: hypothetical protein OEZ06_09945 [Myxococcales bacterium]|nr:hypothetical protein [Myxococcales bacterium]
MVDRRRAEELEEERLEVSTLLRHAYADDLIELDELERRLGLVESAENPAQIQRATQGLPALNSPQAALAEVDAQESVVAVLGGNRKGGRFAVPEQMSALAFWGGAVLDLSEANFGPGLHRIHCTAVMGGVEVIVPPNVRVRSSGLGLMGGFTNRCPDPESASAPVLEISGLAFWGGVSVRPATTSKLLQALGRGARRIEQAFGEGRRRGQRRHRHK